MSKSENCLKSHFSWRGRGGEDGAVRESGGGDGNFCVDFVQEFGIFGEFAIFAV